jgi:hypothetical protein
VQIAQSKYVSSVEGFGMKEPRVLTNLIFWSLLAKIKKTIGLVPNVLHLLRKFQAAIK